MDEQRGGEEVDDVERLKLLACVSELYETLLNDWWLRSVPEDCRPVLRVFSAGPTSFRQGDWHKVTEKKIDLILDHMGKEAEGSVFIMSDLDVQFFRPFADDVRALMQGYDVLFQNDFGTRQQPPGQQGRGGLNSGFIAVRAGADSRRLFERALAYMRKKNDPGVDDQVALRVVTADERQVRLGLLPPRYWTHGTYWTPGQALDPPGDIVTHHANWIVGDNVNNVKLEQLREVREIVERRRCG